MGEYGKIINPQRKAASKKRMSSGVILAISGAVVISAAAVWVYCREQQDESYETQSAQGTEPVANNSYSPGTGYYHSGVSTWYPYSYGAYNPSRGYFYNGQWESYQRTAAYAPEPSVPRTVAKLSSSGSSTRGGFGSSGRSYGVAS